MEPGDLRLITLTHLDFDGAAQTGELIVHKDSSNEMLEVFQALFEAGYPIESMVPIGSLPVDAEDEAEYSNTSGFNCRVVEGTDRWSEHAYGRAIDLNPHLNPFVTADAIWPAGSERYVDRGLDETGMINGGDVVVTAFQAIGWGWGGDWRSLKDYHHFSATGR
ncbi:MAG: M15 family metallopeptidase [Actinomycetota bacterium]|nr:M15 family metallopeptidase [Actinomycetota bacterium]